MYGVRQCTRNVTLRRVRAAILWWKIKKCVIFCVFIGLGTQHAMRMRMRHIVVYVLPGCKISFRIIS